MNPSKSSLYQFTEPERARLAKLIDYSSIQSLPEVWPIVAQRYGEMVALQAPHATPEVTVTYRELAEQIQQFAAGLQALGVKGGDRISLFSDNSPRWFISDQGMMTAGAVNAVRSSQADRDELLFILSNSGSTALVVEDMATFKKLQAFLDTLPIQFVILLSDEVALSESSLKVLNFTELMQLGASQSLQPVSQTPNSLATLIYTSGTSGKPKGVMISHGNLLSQIRTFGVVLQPAPGARLLSILPSWHAYERTVEYFMLSQGLTQIYTNIRQIKRDLKQFKPEYMVAVPRLWESIYEGIQKQFREQPAKKQKLIHTLLAISERYIVARRIVQGLSLDTPNPSLMQRLRATLTLGLAPIHALADRLVYRQVREATGGCIKYIISGGGSLAKHLEIFYEIVGVNILVGYGLTETSPVTHVRRPERNLRSSSGLPLPSTEAKIVELETRQPLPQGKTGLVLLRGPQIMQGYYLNPQGTAKAIDAEGWFDSGDLGQLTAHNELVITGRAKDTIVLTSGENIEPQPIEDACLRSDYIDQIVLVGQDQRSLGALIVPNLEALQAFTGKADVDLDSQKIQDLFRQELAVQVRNRPGYRADDRIGPFRLLRQPFSMENGLMTQTLKIRRAVVMERYRDMIVGMFA